MIINFKNNLSRAYLITQSYLVNISGSQFEKNTAVGHMMKYLLTELGWARWDLYLGLLDL